MSIKQMILGVLGGLGIVAVALTFAFVISQMVAQYV